MYPIIFSLFSSVASWAETIPRIQAVRHDIARVREVVMSPGLATVMTFPCEIDEAIIGRAEDLKAQVSPTTKKQLTLFLSSRAALPTNLLVRCGDQADLMVFDIVPSRTSHQDQVKVASVIGQPTIEVDRAAIAKRTASLKPNEDTRLRMILRASTIAQLKKAAGGK